MNLDRKGLAVLAISAACSGALVGTAQAQAVFNYNNRDMIAAFRYVVRNSSTSADLGTYDVEFNIGQASQFTNATPGQVISITNVNMALVSSTLGGIDSITWSVGGCIPTTDTSGNGAPKTLWVTAPRSSQEVAATPAWVNKSSSSQGTTAAQIQNIGLFANNYSTGSNVTSTATSILIPPGVSSSYATFMGLAGNYSTKFQGDVENTTSATFDSDGTLSRSDLYQLNPGGTGYGTYLGYFELRTNGLFFVANPPVPVLQSSSYQGGIETIRFTTVNGATYFLSATNVSGLTAPVSTWPKASTIVGDGNVKLLYDISSATGGRFYQVGAHK